MNNEQNKECAYCKAGDFETCENCEIKGCPECSEGWRMDSEGCWLCPECTKMIHEEWRRETKDGTEVCGTCFFFVNKDTEGDGWCDVFEESKHFQEYCEDRLSK